MLYPSWPCSLKLVDEPGPFALRCTTLSVQARGLVRSSIGGRSKTLLDRVLPWRWSILMYSHFVLPSWLSLHAFVCTSSYFSRSPALFLGCTSTVCVVFSWYLETSARSLTPCLSLWVLSHMSTQCDWEYRNVESQLPQKCIFDEAWEWVPTWDPS